MSADKPVTAAPALNFWRFPILDSAGFVPDRYRPGNLRTWSGHLPFARDLIASLRPSLLVELGTHYGESYFGFCQSVVEARVSCRCYSVDTWRGDPHAGEYGGDVFEEVERYNQERYGSFSYLLRTAFDDAVSKFSDESIDLLHIDGLHTYAAVRHDWDTWFPKVAPGGIVLLHDIQVRHVDFGVWKLWEEITPGCDSFEFHHGYGLGVIRKPGPVNSHGGILNFLFDNANADAIRRYYAWCANHLDLKADLEAAREHARDPVFQIYYPEDGSFSESRSVSRTLGTGTWQKLSFELNRGIEGSTLRLDPADCPAMIDIGSVTLLHAFDYRELWRCQLQQAGGPVQVAGTAVAIPGDSYLRIFAYGADPWVFITVPAEVPRAEPLILECWIRLHPDFSEVSALIESLLDASRVPIPEEGAPDLLLPETESASQCDGVAKVWVDPEDKVLKVLVGPGAPEEASQEVLELSLQDPLLSKNDWTPTGGESNSWRCATSDPWVICRAPALAAFRVFVVSMSCTVKSSETRAQLFWTAGDCPFEERRSVQFPVVADGNMHSYIVDLGSQVEASLGDITGDTMVRFDPLDSPGEFRIVFAGLVHGDRLRHREIADLLNGQGESLGQHG